MEAYQSGLAVADLSTVKSTGRYPDRVLYVLWALFSVIMIVVAARDYYRSGGENLWKPLLWEGSSMVAATRGQLNASARSRALTRNRSISSVSLRRWQIAQASCS